MVVHSANASLNFLEIILSALTFFERMEGLRSMVVLQVYALVSAVLTLSTSELLSTINAGVCLRSGDLYTETHRPTALTASLLV